MPELLDLKYHPAPFNCIHGCNFGINNKALFQALLFDSEFDCFWGYEDIELGFRLFLTGCKFYYVEDGFVYHQETDDFSFEKRLIGRKRNFELACKKIPYFNSFRKELGR